MSKTPHSNARCRAVVIWIDWYAYHVARFVGLQGAFGTNGEIVGIEMVGGMGVHDGLQFREDLPGGLPIKTLMPSASWKTAGKFSLARLLWQQLTLLDPQVVLIPGYYTLPAIAAAIWARRNRRVSVLMTESTAHDHARSAWKEHLKSSMINRLFDWAVTGGTAHVRYLLELGFAEDRIASFYDVVGNDMLHDGVSAMRSSSSAAEHGLPSDYFLYVGRLAPEKNLGTLVGAWASYRRSGGTRSLVLVGDGPEATEIHRLAVQSGLAEGIVFAGHKSSRELWPYFAFASCFVLPSTREPWGLVVNEAMAASLPVIVSTACGCADNLVDAGRNGYMFNPADPRELTARLLEFDRLGPGERAALGKNSAERIATYSPENFGQQIARIAAEAALQGTTAARKPPIAATPQTVKDLGRRQHDV
jgi:1,2-diacylglycerol 3-alpha-glucosyltransferase